MNKKGFTLIELLAVIVIIALIGGIGTIAYTNLIKKASDDAISRYQDTMHAEAIQYLSNSYNEITYENNVATILLSNLPIDPINNPKDSNDKCLNNDSYVRATRSRSSSGVLSITYEVCLKCNGFDKQCKTYEN